MVKLVKSQGVGSGSGPKYYQQCQLYYASSTKAHGR